jgi:uncharacterized peroxidase-related enzyme
VSRIESNYLSAELGERRTAMLRYAEKLTRRPSDMQRSDVDELRKVGFGDEDVLAIAEVTAYYAFANRIADGLGIEIEPSFTSE